MTGSGRKPHAPDFADRRNSPDRRSGTLRALLYGSFIRRRRGARRVGEAGLAAVDWHHPKWLAVALLILLLSCADALLTLELVRHGAYEANPFMRPFVHGSGFLFAILKVGLTSAGVVILTLLAGARAFGRRVPVSLLLYCVLAAYVALITYELWLLEHIWTVS